MIDYLELVEILTQHQVKAYDGVLGRKPKESIQRRSASAVPAVQADIAGRLSSNASGSVFIRPAHLMLDPNGYPRVTWDMLTIVMLLYLAIVLPYRIGFDEDAPEGSGAYYFETSIDIFFALDIIVNFRTGVISDESREIVMDWKVVAIAYVKSWFVLDLLSTFPFGRIFSGAANTRMIKLIKFSRLAKVLRVLKLSKVLRNEAIADVVEDNMLTSRPPIPLPPPHTHTHLHTSHTHTHSALTYARTQ